MFVLLGIKLNQYSLRTRLLAGLSVALILLLLTSAVSFRLFYFDNITRYTSKSTKIYLRLDLSDTPDTFYRIKIVDSLLRQFHLANLDRHLLDSQLVVICDDFNHETSCGLVINSHNIPEIAKYLKNLQLNYRELSPDLIVISENQTWLTSLKKSHNPLSYLKYQSTARDYGSLTLVINQSPILTSDLNKAIYLSNLPNFNKFNGLITASQLQITPFKLIRIFEQRPANKQINLATDCDIQINSQKGNHLPLTYLAPLLTKPYNLCLKRVSHTGNVIDDYEFTILLNEIPNSLEKVQALETVLLNLASSMQPQEKSYYLKDGTRILELFPNKQTLTFTHSSGTNALLLNNNRQLSYITSTAGLIITNRANDLTKNPNTQSENNIATLKINSLPASQLKNLLGDFSYISFNDQEIIIQ